MKVMLLTVVLPVLLSCLTACGDSEPGALGAEPVNPPPTQQTGDTLYNGIILDKIWPPKRDIDVDLQKGMDVPYLRYGKPEIVDIAIGRQLFVDDFLIENTTLDRKMHYPEYSSSNPVLFPNKRWETVGNTSDMFAAPFSDGIWYDELKNKFCMWYEAGGGAYSVKNYGVTCYAESSDGISWDKLTDLGIVSGTNIVNYQSIRDASTIWLDKQETDKQKRYKMFQVERNQATNEWRYHYKVSSDGVNWLEESNSNRIEDRSTVFYNPFRAIWSFSMRFNYRLNSNELIRCRLYAEEADPQIGITHAKASKELFWFGPWPGELHHPQYSEIRPAIYNHDAIAYESLMLGLFSIWQGPDNEVTEADGTIKRNQIMLGYSRDGYHWWREDMMPFLPVDETEGAWNYGNLQSVAGVPLIVDDKLYFYLSGRKMNGKAQITSTGLATLRRDGFASMGTSGNGVLSTQKLKFDGAYFFVNADVQGSLKVELLDENGRVLSGYSKEDCIVYKGDNCKFNIQWKNEPTLSKLKDKIIKIKFYLEQGELYAFWISPWESGESNGYTAGGGPGLHPSGIDTK